MVSCDRDFLTQQRGECCNINTGIILDWPYVFYLASGINILSHIVYISTASSCEVNVGVYNYCGMNWLHCTTLVVSLVQLD